MKLTIVKAAEIEVDAIRMVLPVEFGDEDMPFDFPHRKGDVWDVTVDLETGVIRDWPQGVEYELDMKVCDSGSYFLLHGTTVVASLEHDYVPDEIIPGSSGDYVELNIGPNGKINDWKSDHKFFSERLRRVFFRNPQAEFNNPLGM